MTNSKSSGVELLVVGALALIAVVSLVFVGLTVMWDRRGDITPLVSIAGVGVGALASLLVKLQGQSGVDVPTPLPVTLAESPREPIPLPSAAPAGVGG